MSCLDNAINTAIPTTMLLDMMNLYRFSGKDSYYNSLFKKDLNAFRNVNIQEEVISFAQIMRLDLTIERLKLLAKKDIVPKNNSEKIVLNLKKLFKHIIYNINHIELLANDILSLTNMMFDGVTKVKFRVEKTVEKSIQNKKETVVNSKLDLVLIDMIKKFESMHKTKKYEVTLLITSFFIDFYNTKVFEENANYDVNEFASYIVLYIMLFKYEFDVFNYKSFFSKIYENMKSFHNAIGQSSFNWNNGFANVSVIHAFIIERLLECYDNLEDEKQKYSFVVDNKFSKTNDVELSILNFPGETFTKSEIQKMHPNVSSKTIERTLDRLQEEGKIESLGTGRSAKWMKKFILRSGFDYDVNQLFDDDDFLEKK
ncbi:MAG: hypothetical protein K6E87_03230 [bacterium]|nr:hypothetical protein [bacterium]